MELYLKNIGKIKEAMIELNGITIIGGENDTGKSTVGKSLFSIFNCFYKVQQQIDREKLSSIGNALELIYSNYYFRDSGQLENIEDYSKKILLKAEDYKKVPAQLKDEINAMFRLELEFSKRLSEEINIDDIIKRIMNILEIPDEAVLNSVVNKKLNTEFNGQILNIYSEADGIISLNVKNEELSIKISEDAVLVNKSDYSLYSRAIYIDDPFVLDNVGLAGNGGGSIYADHRAQLIDILLFKNHNTNVIDEIFVENKLEKIYKKLSSLCTGSLIWQRNGRLEYQPKNSNRSLSVKNLSSGLKTFVILKTLLTNGAIEMGGTVILDEPEIHLHPEWQLLFAELIVLLHKEFGLNILLNTHSPYFLRAIQVYSAKYEKGDVCKYYIAESSAEGASITDVTEKIDKIFEKLANPLQRLEDERWNIDTF